MFSGWRACGSFTGSQIDPGIGLLRFNGARAEPQAESNDGSGYGDFCHVYLLVSVDVAGSQDSDLVGPGRPGAHAALSIASTQTSFSRAYDEETSTIDHRTMAHRLPHLNGLRAFEVVARHLSFVKAGEELGVTAAAVSLQVKTLEDYLGFGLFKRANRALFLTGAGELMLPEVREGFDLVASGLSRARTQRVRQHLVVSITPSIAAKWLMPRLERFNAQFPAIDIRLHTSMRFVDFSHEDVDIAVRYGNGNWPGLEVIPLMGEAIFPVCSPRLLGGGHPLRSVGDMRFTR